MQVRAREEELLNLTSLHTATKASADKRIASLETRVAKLLEANRCAAIRTLRAVLCRKGSHQGPNYPMLSHPSGCSDPLVSAEGVCRHLVGAQPRLVGPELQTPLL